MATKLPVHHTSVQKHLSRLFNAILVISAVTLITTTFIHILYLISFAHTYAKHYCVFDSGGSFISAMESARLDYLLTGNADSLTAYRAHAVKLDSTLSYIQRMCMTTDETRAAGYELTVLYDKYLDFQSEMESKYPDSDIGTRVELSQKSRALADQLLTADDNLINASRTTQSIDRVVPNLAALVLGAVSMIAGVALLAIAGVVSVRRLVTPIFQLSGAITRLGSGNYNVDDLHALSDRKDEIGQFARAVESMAHTTDYREQDLRKQIAETRAQLDLLRLPGQ